MPALFIPGWTWHGDDNSRPASAFVCFDSHQDFLFIGLRPLRQYTEISAIPLELGDEREVLEAWSRIDTSLRQYDSAPASCVGLTAPAVPSEIIHDILRTAGFPATLENLDILSSVYTQQVATKAHQFASASDGQLARRFVDGYSYYPGAGITVAQEILNDLASSSSQMLPYIQDVPMRIRALMLEVSGSPGTFWEELFR